MDKSNDKPKIGLIMSGGGARAAYQVGVLKAISHMLPTGTPNPFDIICGASAGAINSAVLAIYARHFLQAVRRLEKVWGNFRTDQVFRADALGLLTSWTRWMVALLAGGIGKHNPTCLLDRAPLRQLLQRYMPFEKIQGSLDAGHLHAISIAASGYTSGQSVNFFQGVPSIKSWKRAKRAGTATQLSIDHLMASSAIPFIFEAVKLNREYFGDGSMRQVAPISPAIHMGADRVLVIGVRQETEAEYPRNEDDPAYPPLGQIAGHVLSTIFLDSLEADLERLRRVNETVLLIPTSHLEKTEETNRMRAVESLSVSPSRNIGEIANAHRHLFPRPVKFMLRGLGAYNNTGGDLVSYLLFEKEYCKALIDLGYHDTIKRKDEILQFLLRDLER